MPNTPQTTAQLRTAAAEAITRRDFAEAARLFDQAADAYPLAKGALGQADIAHLRRRAEQARQCAEAEAVS
jgi:hypothetical protein